MPFNNGKNIAVMHVPSIATFQAPDIKEPQKVERPLVALLGTFAMNRDTARIVDAYSEEIEEAFADKIPSAIQKLGAQIEETCQIVDRILRDEASFEAKQVAQLKKR